jgi:hypothetical protein
VLEEMEVEHQVQILLMMEQLEVFQVLFQFHLQAEVKVDTVLVVLMMELLEDQVAEHLEVVLEMKLEDQEIHLL